MEKSKFRISRVIIYLVVILFSLACILPLMLMVITSFTAESAINKNGYSFFPEQWSISAYQQIIRPGSSVIRSYGISIFVTITGTVVAVIITFLTGYTLANKHVKYRNALALFYFVTMVFNAGLVPWYIVNRQLGLQDTIFALIIPSLLFSPFNLFLTRNFISGIPDALMESAKMDGANEAVIAFRIYLPLCAPVIATITQFYALGYWNDWFNAVMLVDNQSLMPLQYMLYKLQSDINMLSKMAPGITKGVMPKESFKMATACLTIGPIILLYPFLQKYFVKGMVVGAIKG